MLIKSSIQRELDRFYKTINQEDYNIREATKGALTQARAKLNPWAFIRLNEVATQTFYNEAEIYGWYGFRVVAVDGTRLVLPNHPSVIEEFGQHKFGPNADSPRCLALASMLYDVLNQVTIDAQIAPYKESEKDLLELHLEKTEKGDLLLLDRGYPSISLMYLLIAKGIEFCIRMKEDWWLSVKDFTESGEKDDINKKLHETIEESKEIPSEVKRQLEKLIEQYNNVDNDVRQELITASSLIEIKKYPKAIAVLTKIIENLLKEKYSSDISFKDKMKKKAFPVLKDYLDYAKEDKFILPEEYHFANGLREIRNDDAHDLNPKKSNLLTSSAFLSAVDLILKISGKIIGEKIIPIA
ncbi:MAG: hypothetical protein A2033_02860 [Bacteroidetes bacterium GWA2_31_9]|nr:MAG: hypothetical protein A2033_02860 [Bacteroidetes bacterium GWA2_31_9]